MKRETTRKGDFLEKIQLDLKWEKWDQQARYTRAYDHFIADNKQKIKFGVPVDHAMRWDKNTFTVQHCILKKRPSEWHGHGRAVPHFKKLGPSALW